MNGKYTIKTIRNKIAGELLQMHWCRHMEEKWETARVVIHTGRDHARIHLGYQTLPVDRTHAARFLKSIRKEMRK